MLFFAYSGFNATFTSLGASGKSGPTSLGYHYTRQDHDRQVTVLSSGIQQWTVPYTGQYRMEAVGAAGGYDEHQNSAQYRGRGARMVGTFNLSQGEKIQILVGQEGGIRRNDLSSGVGGGGGGGGGTFIVRGSNTSLIVVGGGGGLRAVTSRHEGCDANTNKSGNPGYKSWSGGSNGNGADTGDDKPSGESDRVTKSLLHENVFDLQNCRFSHDVAKIPTTKLLILLISYLNEVYEQLKTNIYTNFCSEWVLGFAIDYA